ncbi:sorting nexin-29 [Leptinotarsa decemlineata]|uniref:sorting nexin-29 n=1 Tax=Leptinotarsa decemlineata TaxID=7539 RepID=UPI003D30852A
MSLGLMSAIDTSPKTQKPNEADKLLKQLLECVQECQKRFGGKTELATEFDSCVAAICVCLESVFLHGLRSKPLSTSDQNSSLRQVSDILVHTLNIGNEGSSFWPFVKKHLTKHEQERYIVLKQIWTDTGRGRAWIRSSLNERSLERYCHILLSNADLLKEYYESWSILRDEEKNSMLPNMAAGLNSILFAISIDKPDLNSGVTPRPEVHKNKVEPIIETTVPENKDKLKQKKKKKVARQFISFDDDDNSLSTSIPSSSSSTASDTTSLGDNTSFRNKSANLKEIDEEKFRSSKMDKDKEKEERQPNLDRNLSIESSGSREKYSMVLPDTLRPVTNSEIGELTPISVEINQYFDPSDLSNDNIEVPADISALLTSVEYKNKKEISEKDEKIMLLMKENEGLKEQLKKYMSAIQMLRSDDQSIGALLEEFNIELEPDYKGEAKMFEKKLVQVAEMHAELMDFNVILQQNLLQKEALLDKLKSELEILRGPVMSLDEIGSDSTGSVNVWIPSAFLTGTGSSSHHVYQIFLRAGYDEWNIYRRYAQFHALHSDLKKLDSVVGSFDFPPKKSIGKKDSGLVEDRRKRLQVYLRKIIAHWPELAHCNNRYLLEQHLSFFKDLPEDLQNRKKHVSSRVHTVSQSNNHSGL